MGDRPAEHDRLRCLACGAPMGGAVECPACGWTYGPDLAEPEPPAGKSEPAPMPATPGPPPAADSSPVPSMSRRAILAEVLVVLAVAVIPRVIDPVVLFTASGPPRPVPYWADTVELTVVSACEVFVVLYLIGRSGEPRDRFGVDGPRRSDLLLGLAMVAVSHAVALVDARLDPFADMPAVHSFPRPVGPASLLMGVIKFGAAGYLEELVFRGYLITRLGTLFASTGRAVLVAALLFASVHGYQGPRGVVFTFLFGLAYGGCYLVGHVA